MIDNYRLCSAVVVAHHFDILEVRSITICGIQSARSRVKRVHAFYVLVCMCAVCSVHRVDRSYRRDITFYSYDFF